MKLNTDKTRIITFTRKTNSINYIYKLCDKCIICTDSFKDLGVPVDCKLFFHHNNDYICSQLLKMLGLAHTLTFSFSTIDSLLLSHFTLDLN